MGFYIFDSHEVGAQNKLQMVQAIPGVVECEYTPSPTMPWPKAPSMYPVCWVNNEVFEAVGIAYDKQELERFTTGLAGRPFKWFFVPTDELVKMKPHLAEYLRGERSWRE